MTEHEKAEMFYLECMEQAGVENAPPLNSSEEKDELVQLYTTGKGSDA